ncbi:DoxX family membrane protein [Flavobacterium sp. PL002]|uniref:DoxX family protein n=1 Tax=Flavobacterium sp. PL002 TaxID=1897058 RepID=UPI00178862BC|nr:DoxX family membrane protein [Flavobacterium sp. PL002]MBE0391611.1 hypothetical protein [Flavobacterium sp. PL002]
MNSKAVVFWKVIKIVMAIFMIYGGVQHFTNTAFYSPFVPDFLTFKVAIIYISGIFEIAIGLMLLFKQSEGLGALGLFILMLVFLPIHVWDVFSDTPAIGSHQAALIRLPIQFIFIGISWKLKSIYYK